MTDEAAQSREAAGASQNAPGASESHPPPPGMAPPPWFGAPDGPGFAREKLIRPARGRYLAGVCGAIARATNTDPVLWRVLLAVLGFFGGVGLLVYLLGWLLIPTEGYTAAPLESLLGRGRSGMTPVSVVLLGGTAVLVFAFIVQDGFRATLLATAVLVCGALVLKKRAPFPQPAQPAPAGDPTAVFATAGSTAGSTTGSPAGGATSTAGTTTNAADPTTEFATAGPAAGPPPAPTPTGEPVTAPLPPMGPPAETGPATPAEPHQWPEPPKFGPPSGSYRPPFAPHGPWGPGAGQPPNAPWGASAGQPPHAPWGASAGQPPHAPWAQGAEQPPPPPPRPAKKPRERSKLGRITFFGVVFVMGVLTVIDLAAASVPVSGYFAAALATIALGLLVGTWFGRARGLIFLAILTTIGLFISTGAERFGGEFITNSYRPQTLTAVADRYDFAVGTATLDLRALDFTGQDQAILVTMKFGQVKVLLPDKVDVATAVSMNDGRALLYGQEKTGNLDVQGVTDLGADGKGGGNVRLTIQMDTGNVEVTR
ncbi:PspC domain-containing protein [Actinoplanes sp. NPDC051859]|uniref:PspC domain-containing protein n=1 Tax=Actinoplanes sp. NPDC051859 TaxID=3363909 RepID=UPI003791E0E9